MSIDTELTAANIPASVVSLTSTASYTVTAVNFSAFRNHSKLTSVQFPGTITAFTPDSGSGCFHGCSALSSIYVNGAKQDSALSSENGVLYAQHKGIRATLLAYPQAKTDKSFSVPNGVSTVYSYAFAGNPYLTQVYFNQSLTGIDNPSNTWFNGGIGAYAFEGCTALAQVEFAEGVQVATSSTSTSVAIGSAAFRGCTALTSISIPALTSADAKGNYYQNFRQLNPNSNLTTGTGNTFTSGYKPYWHNLSGPIARAGFGSGVFENCTALESVSFQAGNSTGAYAYWGSSSNIFKNCSSLKKLVYQSTQAYWGDPNHSMINGSYTDIWDSDSEEGKEDGHNAVDTPDYYYAVDYYATQAEAEAADVSGSTRLTRMEYKRGTSTADIATSSSSLSSQTCDRSLYAQKSADGVIPDPNEAAAKAGLEGTRWVWRLDNTQSRRSELSESCKAYLAKANELSNGRLDSTHISAEYLLGDKSLSQGTNLCSESIFDAARYYTDNSYQMTGDDDNSPAFTFDPNTGKLIDMFDFVAASGTKIDLDSCKITYRLYDKSSHSLKDASETINSIGIYLVTITPSGASDFSGSFSEWIIVQARDGIVKESYGPSASNTETGAKHALSSNNTQSIDYSNAPYSITVGAEDADGALIASSYAGLAGSAINIDADSNSSSYGFKLNRSFYSNGIAKSTTDSNKKPVTFSREGSTAAAYAVTLYKHFADESNRSRYGLDAVDGEGNAKYEWGDTAVLVPYGRTDDVTAISAYAYAKKAPVFFTEKDGTVSADTLTALKDFANVRVTGPGILYSAKNFTKLAGQLGNGTELSRIGGDTSNSGDFSLAVAEELASEGLVDWSVVTVSDGDDPLDCILALNARTKFSNGKLAVTLVSKSSAQSATIALKLHEQGPAVRTIVLFGRSSNNAANITSSKYNSGKTNAFGSIWKSDMDFDQIKAAAKITKTDPGFQLLKDKNASKKKKSTEKKSTDNNKKKNTSPSKESLTSSDNDDSSAVAAATENNDGGSSSGGSDEVTATQADFITDTGQQEEQESAAALEPAAPWMQVLFIIALIALCGLIVPLMRRCR